jgi:predicted RNA polymerase sigma factor
LLDRNAEHLLREVAPQVLGAVMRRYRDFAAAVFNEGHTSSAGPQLQRLDLAEEAIRLARALHALVPDDPETSGLPALLLLTHARRDARSGPDGALIPLSEQDRSRWDRAAIEEGTRLLEATLPRGRVGPYQLQAAIAALHDEALRAEDTDWAQIAALYQLLERLGDNPVVTLNRAVAVAMHEGPAAGLALLATLDGDARLAGSHRLDAVRGHLLEMQGASAEAIGHYVAAASRTTNLAERNYLATKAARLRERSGR